MGSVFPLSPGSSRWRANDFEPLPVAQLPERQLWRSVLALEQLSGNDVSEMPVIWRVGHAVLCQWFIRALLQQRLTVEPYCRPLLS
jgi:hypothetical protein